MVPLFWSIPSSFVLEDAFPPQHVILVGLSRKVHVLRADQSQYSTPLRTAVEGWASDANGVGKILGGGAWPGCGDQERFSLVEMVSSGNGGTIGGHPSHHEERSCVKMKPFQSKGEKHGGVGRGVEREIDLKIRGHHLSIWFQTCLRPGNFWALQLHEPINSSYISLLEL